MKFILVLTLAVVAASALPQGDRDVQITKLENDNDGLGVYSVAYELSDGTKRNEQGNLKAVGDVQAQVQQGQYSYTAPDGQVITTKWIADENGFQPQGAHIPQPQ